MVGRGSSLIPISTSNISINNFYAIARGRVYDLLRPNSTSSVITPTITSFIVINTIIDMIRGNRYTIQSIMVTWFMVGIVAGLGPISTYSITINRFYNISIGRVADIFRPISTSAIANTYINPLITIITTYISPPGTIISTDITPLSSLTTIFLLSCHHELFC